MIYKTLHRKLKIKQHTPHYRKMGHHAISARAIDFASFGVPVRF
jgi:hypothetical protein